MAARPGRPDRPVPPQSRLRAVRPRGGDRSRTRGADASAPGEADTDELVAAVRDSMLDVAATQTGELVLGPSPDGVPCALVATSTAHHRRDLAEHWWQLTIEEILAALPADTDVLLNPGGAESVRLLAAPLRAATADPPRP